jgi:hypothetical protein
MAPRHFLAAEFTDSAIAGQAGGAVPPNDSRPIAVPASQAIG